MPFGADFLQGNDETKRIEFEGGAWVDIKIRALIGDEAEALNAATRGTTGPEVQFNIGDFRVTTLFRRIVAWSAPEPVTWENVAKIPSEMAQQILEEIDRLSARRSDDQKKVSTTNVSPTLSRAARRRGRKS
jgi:hypothetical protein